jgi:hypothetical protein
MPLPSDVDVAIREVGKVGSELSVTRLMRSFFASAVEKVAFAPVSLALTVRSAAGLINTGSTARFRSSAATVVPFTAGMTFGFPLTRRTVASLGSTSSTFLIAGRALRRGFFASSTGTRVPF